jgi:hypothetical protein
MKTKLIFIIILIAALFAACVPTTPAAPTDEVFPPTNTSVPIAASETPTTVVPTEIPTAAPSEPIPTAVPILVRLVVQTANHDILLVDPNIILQPGRNPAFGGLNPSGAVINGTAYVYDFITSAQVLSVDENGAHALDFIQIPTYGVAAWQGATGADSRLAWGTQLIVPTTPSSLQISAADGSNLETLYTQEVSVPPVQLVVQKFAQDGRSLYFSREPVGLGGYILFAGASSLQAAKRRIAPGLEDDVGVDQQDVMVGSLHHQAHRDRHGCRNGLARRGGGYLGGNHSGGGFAGSDRDGCVGGREDLVRRGGRGGWHTCRKQSGDQDDDKNQFCFHRTPFLKYLTSLSL